MIFSLVLDILLAILLAVTIAYAVTLNRKLGVLRQDRAELERLTQNFGESTRRAEESIGRLRATADTLQERIDKAQALRDDLAFLADRGGSTADRLEDLVRAARKETGGPVIPAATAKAAAAAPSVQAGTETPRAPAPRPAPAPAPEPRPAPPARAPLQGFPEPRSEAERELLKALESAR